MAKKWTGTPPATCDLCNCTLKREGTFIDGRTKRGPWATMCHLCHFLDGVGLGTGLGQQYTLTNGEWLKVEPVTLVEEVSEEDEGAPLPEEEGFDEVFQAYLFDFGDIDDGIPDWLLDGLG